MDPNTIPATISTTRLEAEMAAEAAGAEQADLTEEERALLALGELGKTVSEDSETTAEESIDISDEDILAELEGLDLDEDLLMEGGDDAADPQ